MSPNVPTDRMYDDAKALLAKLSTTVIRPVKWRIQRRTHSYDCFPLILRITLMLLHRLSTTTHFTIMLRTGWE